eukprot:SAG31_NODE_2988_length_4814_cov_11.404030_3_plen_65_part_00
MAKSMLWSQCVEKMARAQEFVGEGIAAFCELAKPIAHADADRTTSAHELVRYSEMFCMRCSEMF